MSSNSKERKKAALYQKLLQLRASTNSSDLNETSIIVDASKYIKELKCKVDTLSQGVGTSQNSIAQNPLPAVTVQTLEKGFQIHVLSEKKCPGLLVSILEAFEELGLDVHDARVSCSDTFQLEAVGERFKNFVEKRALEGADSIDAQAVEQAVLQAIQTWSASSEQDY